MKSTYLIVILYFSFCSSSSIGQQIITDSLIKEVIHSIYPAKSYLKLKIEELPPTIYSKSNWEAEDEMEKYFILKVKGFDSLAIKNQLIERENINIDNIVNRKLNLFDSSKNGFREVRYILFSKDLNMVIIKEMAYCGEDCGSQMTILYKRNKRGDWLFEKSIFGGIY